MPNTPTSLASTVQLNNGVEMPWLGLGVWQCDDKQATSAVRWAIQAGYRAVDTATVYGNERGVGQGLRDSGVAREELFVTTKLWNEDHRKGRAHDAIRESLDRLQLDYVDLYLIHWPVGAHFVDTWHALEAISREGLARAIGVSNFMRPHLDKLLPQVDITPAVNQIEFHPQLLQPDLIAFCQDSGIVPEAWSPLMKGAILDVPQAIEIGERHGKSAAQVVLRWDLQHGVVTIPKSANQKRIVENGDVFDFELSDHEMAQLDALDIGRRVGPDPMNFSF